MLNHPTYQMLLSLKLDGMADVYAELLTHDASGHQDPSEWISLMAAREKSIRDNRRLQSRLRAAKLRDENAKMDTVDFSVKRNLDSAQFEKLQDCEWIRARKSILITGPCGVGKSYLACALGFEACRHDHAVLYYRMPQLFADLAAARETGNFDRLFRKIARADVLIIDDWGPDVLTSSERRDLMEIVDERYMRKSTIVTSQLPVAKWYDTIADATFADAILDRLVHQAHRFELDGHSLRKTLQEDQRDSRKPVFAQSLSRRT